MDEFYVAVSLKAHQPKAHALLSTIPIPAAGDEETIYQASPKSGYSVLSHDPVTKELSQVRWPGTTTIQQFAMIHEQPGLRAGR